jgi:hypothetical protein
VLRIFERFEKAWKHVATGWVFFTVFLACFLWWLFKTPSIGYAIGLLAVVAAVMAALMEYLKAPAKFAWILLLFGFLWVEMKAIDEDKRISTNELTAHFNEISKQAQQNLKNILDDESKNFTGILANQQQNFAMTTGELIRQERQQAREFGSVLAKEQQLF